MVKNLNWEKKLAENRIWALQAGEIDVLIVDWSNAVLFEKAVPEKDFQHLFKEIKSAASLRKEEKTNLLVDMQLKKWTSAVHTYS